MAALPVVPGEPALAPKVARPAARLHLVGKEAAQQPPRARTTLSPVTDSELARVRRANGGSTAQHLKRLVIGIERDAAGTVPLPASSDLQWIAVDDGHAARMTVTSPEAAAMRVSFALAGVPATWRWSSSAPRGPSGSWAPSAWATSPIAPRPGGLPSPRARPRQWKSSSPGPAIRARFRFTQ
jgi:hypothetical protein